MWLHGHRLKSAVRHFAMSAGWVAGLVVRRIVVDRRHGHAEQAQVHGQLSAMMDGVVEHLSAQHQPARLREDHMVARLEAPRRLKMLVARSRDGGARGGDVIVEEL